MYLDTGAAPAQVTPHVRALSYRSDPQVLCETLPPPYFSLRALASSWLTAREHLSLRREFRGSRQTASSKYTELSFGELKTSLIILELKTSSGQLKTSRVARCARSGFPNKARKVKAASQQRRKSDTNGRCEHGAPWHDGL